jgi:hypothetical protein
MATCSLMGAASLQEPRSESRSGQYRGTPRRLGTMPRYSDQKDGLKCKMSSGRGRWTVRSMWFLVQADLFAWAEILPWPNSLRLYRRWVDPNPPLPKKEKIPDTYNLPLHYIALLPLWHHHHQPGAALAQLCIRCFLPARHVGSGDKEGDKVSQGVQVTKREIK